MPNFGSVQISYTLPLSVQGSILFECDERRAAAVVKDWPDGGIYWRGSSQILQDVLLDEAVTSYWAPHALHIRRASDVMRVGFGSVDVAMAGVVFSSTK